MCTYHAIETEVEFRRREWQREVEGEARLAQLSTRTGRTPWLSRSLTRWRSFAFPRLHVSVPLVPRCGSVTC